MIWITNLIKTIILIIYITFIPPFQFTIEPTFRYSKKILFKIQTKRLPPIISYATNSNVVVFILCLPGQTDPCQTKLSQPATHSKNVHLDIGPEISIRAIQWNGINQDILYDLRQSMPFDISWNTLRAYRLRSM